MLASLVLGLALLGAFQQPERIADIQIHGNTLTPDADMLELAGIQIGMIVEAGTPDEVAARLRATHKFQQVEVLKRFASIADSSQVAIVIVVDEGPVTIRSDGSVGAGAEAPVARVEKSNRFRLMFLPILEYEDGYGFTYGIQLARPDPLGAHSRLSFPLTWGGDKHAGVRFDKEVEKGPISRVQAGADVERRTNPFFREDDDRTRTFARAERDFGPFLRVGASTAWDRVSFLESEDRMGRVGADVVFDTRIDPMLARNAVYARASWDRLAFQSAADASRTELEGRGYLGLIRQSVLVLRAVRQDSDRPLPPYLKPMLGGASNLRGFRAGSAIGDTLVAASVELRLPLTSPLSVGKLGVSAFVDAAQVYNKGETLRAVGFEGGFGGGVWVSATFIRLSLYVAHGVGRSTRVHFGTTVLF